MSPLVVEQELERERERKRKLKLERKLERERKNRTITKTVRGPYARSPQVQYVYAPSGLSVPSNVA